MHVRRLPIGVAIFVELLCIYGAFNGYPKMGWLALINGGIFVYQFGKAYYEIKEEEKRRRWEAMRAEEAISREYSEIIRAVEGSGYSDKKTENLEKLAMMVYMVPLDPNVDRMYHLSTINELKELVAKETNAAIQAQEDGYEMSAASKERIERVRVIVNRGFVSNKSN